MWLNFVPGKVFTLVYFCLGKGSQSVKSVPLPLLSGDPTTSATQTSSQEIPNEPVSR